MARKKKRATSAPKYKTIKGRGRCKSKRVRRSDGVMTTVWVPVKKKAAKKRRRR